MSTPTYSLAELAARDLSTYRRYTEPKRPARRVLERFPAGGPRGQWPAESYAAEQRRQGVPARVVMDLPSDSFLVIVEGA